MRFLTLLLGLFSFPMVAQYNLEQPLISYQLLDTYEQETLVNKWKSASIPQALAPINYDVAVYEVIYAMPWHDGTPIKASGLYYVPKESATIISKKKKREATEGHPMLCYHHGTQIRKYRKVKLGGEKAICVGFATDGYLVARPDYMGLGKGERNHLYHHVETQAGASIYLLRAIETINKELHIQQNDQLFITGYSQGGHVTLSFQKTVQESYAEEFKVTASAPMSGAYDLGGVQEGTMFKPYSHPGYLPYLIFSYNEIYNLYNDPTELLISPYDSVLPTVYNGEHSMNYINGLLPEVPKDMLQPTMVKRYLEEPDFPFKKALKENSVHDWKPEQPVLFCYCEADEQVNYQNSIVAYERMKELGAENLRLKRVNKHLGHVDCAAFAVMHTKLFFDSFRKGSKTGKAGPIGKRFLLGLGKGIVSGRVKKTHRRANR
ncbi:MAG: alpha/beta hydrolase family protein [Aureispira sp.]